MENVSEFDLNASVRFWLERLAQSPHFRKENVVEMETHVRDSIVRLQNQGLSAEESFLIAVRRVGTVEKLETEFAKVNRSPRNMIIHALILIWFSVACWFLWAVMLVPRMMALAFKATGGSFAGFTQWAMDFSPYLAVPPLLALVYCLWVWFGKSNVRNSWIGFAAATFGVTLLLAFPIIIAVLLPFKDWINHLPK
jgi:hypothetical protein